MIFTKGVLERFSMVLVDRISQGDTIPQETITSSLSTALREIAGISESEIRFELPYPRLAGAKVDGFLPPSKGHSAAAWEIKYDHRIPSGKNQPKPNKAGALINDFFRLATLDEAKDIERVAVYLTDDEMAFYLRRPANGFGAFFDLAKGQWFRVDAEFLAKRAPSVRNKVKAPITTCYAVGNFAVALPRQHELRVYGVCLTQPE